MFLRSVASDSLQRRTFAASQQRFSLLLLEFGEHYFEDFSCFYYPPAASDHESQRRKIRGRLKLCSKSLVFDPADISYPIMTWPWQKCTRVEQWQPPIVNTFEETENVLVVESMVRIEMRENNTVSPYITRKDDANKGQHRFSFNYVPLASALPRMIALYRVSKLDPVDCDREIANIESERQSQVTFDTSWLVDLQEQIILETTGDRVTPLVSNPGRIMLTSMRVYFQPFNNVDPEPVQKYELASFDRAVTRRYRLRQVGIELFFKGHFGSLFFAFARTVQRDQFHSLLTAQLQSQSQQAHPSEFTVPSEDQLTAMRHKWQRREIDNFTYLMFLNSCADRSVNDITQYYVFPWVVKDYQSDSLDLDSPETFRRLDRPMGALDESRLEVLRERFAEMPEPRFLFGTHYSTPAYVLSYLVRTAPQYMLCLQNGQFDKADRLFHSVAETYASAAAGSGDVRELIPEFYDTDAPELGDFLRNSDSLQLGTRQDGQMVHHVQLPPWAHNSSADFIRGMRAALESEYVSAHLHEWIELVFGAKQRGEAAIAADNVFYHLTYEGAIDIDAIADPKERASIEMQINEFGQTPRQLFTERHPCRNDPLETKVEQSTVIVNNGAKLVVGGQANASAVSTGGTWNGLSRLERVFALKTHKQAVTGVCTSNDGSLVVTVSQDSLLKIHQSATGTQLRSVNLSPLALSDCCMCPDGKTCLVASWDNCVYVYSVEYGRVVDQWTAHDDAVSAVCLGKDVLLTASWDSSVKVWQFPGGSVGHRRSCAGGMPFELLAELCAHDAEVRCVDIGGGDSIAVSGGADGTVIFWAISDQMPTGSFMVHPGCEVNAVALLVDGKARNETSASFSVDDAMRSNGVVRAVSAGSDGFIRVTDMIAGEIACVRVGTAGTSLQSLTTNGLYVVSGSAGGTLHLHALTSAPSSGVTLTELKEWGDDESGAPAAHTLAALCISADATTVVSGADDGSFSVWLVE